MCGYTTQRTAFAAITASTALPPSRSTCAPTSDAVLCGVAMTPLVTDGIIELWSAVPQSWRAVGPDVVDGVHQIPRIWRHIRQSLAEFHDFGAENVYRGVMNSIAPG
jgi:hypothetical protein